MKNHTDASAFQLGAVISKKGEHFVFYSGKVTAAQQQYTVIERELLSTVETLNEFRTILLGQILMIHTDHKNHMCKIFNTSIVLRCRLIFEEYGIYI